MAAIVIHSQSAKNLELLSAIATKLGESVTPIEEEWMEDFSLGMTMKRAKTGKEVSRETIMQKLRVM